MRNTKYLFDENKMTADGCVSVSQLQTFLSCRRKWAYGYIENLMPRVERSYLTVGKLCHKGMQMAMRHKWGNPDSDWKSQMQMGIDAMKAEWQNYFVTTDFLDEELIEVEQLLSDSISIFSQAFEEFEPWKYEILTVKQKGMEIPALELHFVVPCPPTKGLHGYIDAILKDTTTNFIWCTDYKFRKSLSPDEDEANNIQNATYAYACQKMGIDITGTMTWQHVNTPAADPKINKDGTISKAKIKTTLEHYTEFCLNHGIEVDEALLMEMDEKLRDIEWYRATYEYRNSETVGRIWKECVLPGAKAIKSAHGQRAVNYRSLYPWNCKMCQYQSLCQAELRGYDAEYIMTNDYTKRVHARQDNKPID